jgi:1-acyl-sn-glycerol-3-phosphate acyltransferase
VRPLLIFLTWIQLFLVASIGFFFVLAVWLVTRPFDSRRILSGRMLRIVAMSAAKTSLMWRFDIHGPLPARKPKRTVCVSNHCSHTDVFLISHLPWEMKWLAKKSLFKIPFIGWGMWLVGDVAVVRSSPQAAKAALDECARWLDRGVPVMIFPEGTRSETLDLLPFKDGAFRMAIQTQAEILPMAVAGTHNALPKHGAFPGSARGLVRVGEPIPTQGLTLSDLPQLKATVRAEILKLREQILPHTTR